MDAIQFLATIRPIQSALSISGNEDGARLTLDIPESELPAIARLLLMRGKVLRVTVEIEADDPPGEAPQERKIRRWNDRA